MKYIFKQKILTLELLLLLVSNIVLLNLPLTNILGYEYSALNGILITFLSGVLTISKLKKGGTEKAITAFFRELFENMLPVIILPLIMGLIAALFVKNCSLIQGVFYYLVLTVPALVVGCSLGLISFLISSKFSYLNLILTYLAILFLPLAYIYINPQIYFYNPIIGYFPGTIYDEALKIDFKLISYRILNILYFSLSAWAAFKLIGHKSLRPLYKAAFFAAMLFIAAVFIYSGDGLGYSTTKARIIKELGGHVSTEHFEIYYDSKIDLSAVKNIILHNEYYFERIADELKVKPSQKVTIFLFYDSAQKKNLMGSANADVAKPWLYQLYINYSNYETTLQHEIVHCISSEFGVTPFKISHGFNPSLLEGLAVALEDDYNEHTIHYMAALAYNNNFRPPIEKLFEGFNFFGELSSLSYIYSGSFIRFLIDRYGVEKIKEIYKGEGCQQVYGRPLNSLIGEYYSFISSYKPIGSPDEAAYYFGRKPIFKKVCARFLAENIDRAWDLYNSGQFTEAGVLFQKLLNYSESYQSLLGYVSSLKKADKPQRALEVLKENLAKYNKTSYYYNLELMTADLLALNENFIKADSIYKRLLDKKASREYVYLSQLRREMIRDTSLIRSYLKGSDFDKYVILKALNKDSVNYSSIPVLTDLSERLKENYAEFMKQWINRLNVSDFQSGYAAFKLSDYALKNLKFQDSRELLIMALNYKGDADYQEAVRLGLKKVNWFINFGEVTLSGAKWQ
ncbi:MAG: tetratricopeptide repeat protein [Syntrophomonadaceae bacterium]